MLAVVYLPTEVKFSLRLDAFLLALAACCSVVAGTAQTPTTQPTYSDYTMPSSGQVSVPAEGGLIFPMKVNGHGPFATVFDTGAVNLMSAEFAKGLGLKIEEKPVDFRAIGGAVKARTAHVDTL